MPTPRRRTLLRALSVAALAAALPGAIRPLRAATISSKETVAALREALTRASRAAVAQLSIRDGYFGDPRVRIPLPEHLVSADRLLRRFGFGRYLDQLGETMNRAAEAAAGEATPILLDALSRMTIADARGIVGGGDDAATRYFREQTDAPLGERFRPIVARHTAELALAPQYDKLAKRAARFGLIRDADADLDGFVTRKALDGLWLVVADQEKAIRKDPVATGSALLRRVFSGLR